ncbi:MAG: hypothetical protein NZT61_06155 [Deltaproteobacteria bacterium]|nr:hypothetical protein [Deltaproteobacteria bacterium]
MSFKVKFSDAELDFAYNIARFFVENGQLEKARKILVGLNALKRDPDITSLLCFVYLAKSELTRADELVNSCSEEELKMSFALQVFSVLIKILQGRLLEAGTLLGDIKERHSSHQLAETEKAVIDFLEIQLALRQK